MSVQVVDNSFNFDGITLSPPVGVQGGAYFSKVKFNDEKLIIQTPKCNTKNGIKKTGKKSYCDLKFNNENITFLEWTEKLEEKIKSLIFEHKDNWFHDDLEKDDIEYNWNSIVRTYKQKFFLFRTFVEKSKMLSGGPKLQIWNEDREKMTIDDVQLDSNMICILQVKGLKFTSQSFHLECSLIQIMLLADEVVENTCLIKIKTPPSKTKTKLLSESTNTKDLEKVEDGNGDTNVDDETKMDVVGNTNVDTNDETNMQGEVLEETQDETNEGEEKNENKKKNLKEETDLENDNVTNNESNNVGDQVELNENLEELESKESKDLEKSDEMLEINLELPKDLEINTIKLKKPNEVYIEMYKAAKNKAKLAKKLAIEAYLESKQIKKTYMLNEIEDCSDDEDLENLINSGEDDKKLIK